MAINDVVQYTSGFIPYILLFTQAPILVWLDGTIIDISTINPRNYVLQQQWLCWVIIGGGAW